MASRILGVVCGVVCAGFAGLGAGCGPVAGGARTAPAGVDLERVFYERFAAGDPVTDQAAGAPGSYSTLVGTTVDGADVHDGDFATLAAARALRSGASLYLVLNQCYGGGFLDDVARLGGTQSALTAARHSETASYAYEPPSGVDLDSTDTFIAAMGDGTVPAELVAREAVAANPFGPNPQARRTGEPEGSEHAQYMALGGGEHLRLADHAATGMAVLWAGQPAERDGVQMGLMIDRLVAMGYPRSSIWLLYAGGRADVQHPIVQAHMQDADDSIHLLAATRANLDGLFARAFDGTQGQNAAPGFVFLYVGDHGGLDGHAVAKHNFGQPDTLVTPVLKAENAAALVGDGLDAFR